MQLSLQKEKRYIWLFLFLNLIIIPLVYIPSAMDPALESRYLIWSVVLLVFNAFLLGSKRKSLVGISRWPLIFLAAFVGYGFISVFFAVNKAEAIAGAVKSSMIFSFIITGIIMFSEHVDLKYTISKFIIVLGLIYEGIGLFQLIDVLNEGTYNHQVSYLISGLSAHRNLYSQSLVLILPFSIFGFITLKKTWRVLSIVSGILALGLILILLTKSVWLSLILAAIITILTFLNYYSFFASNRKALYKLLAGIGGFSAIVFIVFLLYAKIDSWETLNKQTYWIQNYKFGSSLERIDLWEKSMQMYRDNVFTGVGSNNWRIELPAYGTDGLRSEEGQIFFNRAHNDFIQVLSETGIPGFIFYAAFFIFLFFCLYFILKSELEKEDKIFSLFLYASLLVFIIISLLSFPRERVELNILFGVIALSILHTYGKIQKAMFPLRFRTSLIVASVLLLVLNIIIGVFRFHGEINLKKALIAREQGQWDDVIQFAEKADTYFYGLDNTSIPVSWYTGSAWFHKGNTENAFEKFEHAYRLHPHNLHVLNNLGTCFELKGEHDKAIELYKQAIEISSTFIDAKLNLTAVYFNLDLPDNAYEIFAGITPDQDNSKYKQTLLVLMRERIKQLNLNIEDADLLAGMQRIFNDDEWVSKVYQNAFSNDIHFDVQVVTEAIYVMEIMDQSISKKRAKYLKNKYLQKEQ